MRRIWLGIIFVVAAFSARAETFRVASFNAALTRAEAGALIADLKAGDDAQIAAVLSVIEEVAPDILLINELDWDGDGIAVALIADLLFDRGQNYKYQYVSAQNTGRLASVDLSGDGKVALPEDGFGYGNFEGQYAMALFSKYPIVKDEAREFTKRLWRDLSWAELPKNADGSAFLSEEQLAAFRLSSKGHWDVPIEIGKARLHILAAHPTPPVFDGEEDLNGLRNAAEIGFWQQYIEGEEGDFDAEHFVIMGDLNADPNDGDGRREVIAALLEHEKLQDPIPKSEGGVIAAREQGQANAVHNGDPALDTADWRDEYSGNLRVDYVLPSANLQVLDSGVYWPDLDGVAAMASDHRLVWVDIEIP